MRKKGAGVASLFEAELSCSSSSWYSPEYIVEPGRKVLGEIDLDPATSDRANQTIRAHEWFTEAHDGLALPWAGRVWLNPPSPPGPWWERLVEEHLAGRVTSAIFIVYAIGTLQNMQGQTPGAPFNKWPICIPKKRIAYGKATDQLGLDGHPVVEPMKAPTHASAIIGLGVDVDLFREAYSHVGMVR